MLRLQNERMKGALLPSAGEFFKHYGLTQEKLALAKPDAIVMHPGPMNRGVEIDSPVADGERSVILPQVTFGIAVRMAVMSMVAGNWMRDRDRSRPHRRSGERRRPRSVAVRRRRQDRRRSARRPRDGGPNASSTPAASWSRPGLVDLSARLREPGLEYKATLESEMAAAIAGGVTSLACPPDTDPPLDEPGLVEMLKHRARTLNQAHVYPIGALTVGLAGSALTEMGELAEAGCVAFSQADVALADTELLRRAMQYAATFGYRCGCARNDPYLGRDGVAHDGEVATRLGLAGIPRVGGDDRARHDPRAGARNRCPPAPVAAVVRGERRPGARREARRACPSPATSRCITCTCATSTSAGSTRNARLVPPLRTTRDREALRAGLADGTIDLVCSDHAPVDDDGKQLPFGEAEPGATGLELLLPLTLKWADEDGVALPDALARVTSAPARLIGGARGDLAVGQRRGHLHLRPARVVEGRARRAAQPGQEHAVPRTGSAGARALYTRRGGSRLQN